MLLIYVFLEEENLNLLNGGERDAGGDSDTPNLTQPTMGWREIEGERGREGEKGVRGGKYGLFMWKNY